MSLPPVTQRRIDIASNFLANVEATAEACRVAGLPFYVSCALSEMESTDRLGVGGRNIYGHYDKGGVFADPDGPDIEVTDLNYTQFLIRVLNGETSNGVGPRQITYAGELRDGHRDGGYFRIMAELGLRPWVPYDNILFGDKRLVSLKTGDGWGAAYAIYNGGSRPSTKARARGVKFEGIIDKWRTRLHISK